jgi:hypothetical protein
MSTFSLRLADDDYEALQAMALLTGRSMSALVRAAVAETLVRFVHSTRHEVALADGLVRRRDALAVLEKRATSADAS